MLGPFGLVESYDSLTNDSTDDHGGSITKYMYTVWCANIDVIPTTLQAKILFRQTDLVQISNNCKC
jgi:hypothetical protein